MGDGIERSLFLFLFLWGIVSNSSEVLGAYRRVQTQTSMFENRTPKEESPSSSSSSSAPSTPSRSSGSSFSPSFSSFELDDDDSSSDEEEEEIEKQSNLQHPIQYLSEFITRRHSVIRQSGVIMLEKNKDLEICFGSGKYQARIVFGFKDLILLLFPFLFSSSRLSSSRLSSSLLFHLTSPFPLS